MVKNKVELDETYVGVMLKVHAAVLLLRHRLMTPKWQSGCTSSRSWPRK